jgi:hypothetical protein
MELEGTVMKTLDAHLAESVLRSLVEPGLRIGVSAPSMNGRRALEGPEQRELEGRELEARALQVPAPRGQEGAVPMDQEGPALREPEGKVIPRLVALVEMERAETLPALVTAAHPEVVALRRLAVVGVSVSS